MTLRRFPRHLAFQFGALSGGSTANNNDFTAGTQFNGIAFTSGAPSYNLQGNAINLAGPLQNQSSNSQTVEPQYHPGRRRRHVDSGTAGLTVSGGVGGTGPLTKIGAGALVLAGSNTYTGATNVNQGILALGAGGSLANTALTIGGAPLLRVPERATPPCRSTAIAPSARAAGRA